MSSLRKRFVLAVLAGQVVLLGAGTWLGYGVGERAVTGQYDEALKQQVLVLASLLEQEGRHVGIEIDPTHMRTYFPGDEAEYFELYFGDYPLGRSPALEDRDLTRRFGTAQEPEIWNEPLPDGRDGRYIGVEVTVSDVESDPATGEEPEAADIIVILARSRESLERATALLLWGLLAVDALLILGGLVIAWQVVSSSLSPIRRFARRVGEVDVHTMSEPLDPEEVPRELQPVVRSLNELLGRLDAVLRAERRSTSNMAHELMTPISELRLLSEIALQEGGDEGYRVRALAQAHEISLQMTGLIRMIRQLASVQGKTQTLPGESTALAPLVERVLTTCHEQVEARGLTLDVEVNGEVVDCNRDALQSVFGNLVRNAVAYAPEGAHLHVRSWASDGRATLRITNPCESLGPEHLAHLSEPFWRRSESRTDASHHGLGLTIAEGIAVLAGIELRFGLEDGRFVADAVTPLATPAPDGESS